MKVVIDPRGDHAGRFELEAKLAEVLTLLAAETPPERQERLAALAAVLREHTPAALLAAPSARRLADWLSAFLEIIESRREEAAVRLVPADERGRFLLATNSPDAPFLFDSVQSTLALAGVRFHILSHPILCVRRRRGEVTRLGGLEQPGPRESLIIIELERVPPATAARLVEEVAAALRATLAVARDRRALDRQLRQVEATASEPAREFCRWLAEGNFLPFAYCRLRIEGEGEQGAVAVDEPARLGLPPGPDEPSGGPHPLAALERGWHERLLRRDEVVVEEVERLSPVCRPERLVCIGFREVLAAGAWNEHAFWGLFTGRSLDEPTEHVPALRRRIEWALEALAIPRGCHDWRKTVEIFNTFPKVELFFMEPGALLETVRSFTLLYRHGAVKVVAARSLAVRGLTLLVIMPREFYAEESRSRIEAYLRRYFRSPSVAARVIHIAADYLSLHVALRPAQEIVRLDSERLERGLTKLVRPWVLRLRLLLERGCGEERGAELWQKYAQAFPGEYRALIHPRLAMRDVRRLEEVAESRSEAFDLWGPFGRREPFYRLQFYSLRESYLNELMPLLENLSLAVVDEVDFALQAAGETLYIKSFTVRSAPGGMPLSAVRGILVEALGALRRGEAENDYLNRLLPLTGLDWRQIDVFRAYRNYYFQLGSPFTKRRVAFALIHNPGAAGLLFRYFEARFRPDPRWQDPLRREEEALSPLRQELAAALEAVTDINEDRILRTLFNLFDSTVRTNFFLRRGREDYFLSFKTSPLGIIEMPAPRPMFEIYVHSAAMEGIHLRGGKVARGGIRWSDRPDDFRTEILGLMKTQMTKNAQIIPVGAKGGFVVKAPFTGREEGAALAVAAYRTLIRGMLDLTDNRLGGRVARPEGIVAYDEEDPYLVVAADKGTAHLSDTANAISAEYGFWLGDAFASGGSRGYDHKALGITARGAWECVKRHFREMGRNIQAEPFTVIGIGDMSGDVFGNGMLLSRRIRLLAAFDHRHIFLDPDPDPDAAWEERRRLFALPRSSWGDYDRRLISPGGGVWPRDAKEIVLSPEVRRWLGVRQESLDGPGLIRLLLVAEADLLWNGGIGTYVKASGEKHEEVGDRANDQVRVDAGQLRVRVVGEGGNLGFTQRARIEYALAGGRINTDAVDNSGGVDCSDHEVNLKILMQQLLEAGVVASTAARDALLSEVTDEVCAAVLGDNFSQSLCLSLDQRRAAEQVEPFLDLADRLEASGLLDRQGEGLPAAREVLTRAGASLTRPELAILMAYAKMQLSQALLGSTLPDRPACRKLLGSYFPAAIRERFGDRLAAHPLAREITVTVIANAVVNQAGCAFAGRLARQAGAPFERIVAAYLAFDQVLDGPSLRRQLHAIDGNLAAEEVYRLLLGLEQALFNLCAWALEHGMEVGPEEESVGPLREKALAFDKSLSAILPGREWEQCKAFAAALGERGLSPGLAGRLSVLPYLDDLLPTASLVEEAGADLYSAARTFNELRERLGLREILRLLDEVPGRDRWDRTAARILKGGFEAVLYALAREALRRSAGNLDAFLNARRTQFADYRGLRERLLGTTPVNYHPFTVLLRALESVLP
jgi:glutamate dehydrogenase